MNIKKLSITLFLLLAIQQVTVAFERPLAKCTALGVVSIVVGMCCKKLYDKYFSLDFSDLDLNLENEDLVQGNFDLSVNRLDEKPLFSEKTNVLDLDEIKDEKDVFLNYYFKRYQKAPHQKVSPCS